MTGMPGELSDVLLGQWRDAPRLRAVVTEVIQPIRDDALAAIERIEEMVDIDKSEGIWLDLFHGSRLGLLRPSTTDPARDERFGFDQAGVGFDQGPFRGDAANDARYPLPDGLYRRLLRARLVLLYGDGTMAALAEAVAELDPTAAVQDGYDMTVRIVTARRPLLELADRVGALPRTAGVRIVYADRGRFGFDRAGVGFDQGPFA